MRSRLFFLSKGLGVAVVTMASVFVLSGCGDSADTNGNGECTANDECAEGEYCEKAVGDCEGTGECTTMPVECPLIWAPVCGCDGETYGNECEAAGHGVNVLHEGECPIVEECNENEECADGKYCEKEIGDCEGTGECTLMPETCPENWDPVCGCDGVTYGNECQAAGNGVNVLHEGECSTVDECSEHEECGEGEYCEKEIGDCDGTGECTTMPDSCPDISAPVCGCDNVTYENECEAGRNGVNVLHEGECSSIGECTENKACGEGEYCKKEIGVCDGTGQCTEMPTDCPFVWVPVCGCDNVTYGNACDAALNGVNVLHEGECVSGDECTENGECGDDEYCKTIIGDCGGIGECTLMPYSCPFVWDPVCGCDGNTYANDCFAAADGVSLMHEGECSLEDKCLENDECGESEYCDKAIGDCDGMGECTPIPEGCPDVWAPVCGCDTITYGNACHAAQSEVNVLYEGECSEVVCTENNECSEEEYCAKSTGDCDGEGNCAPVPITCPLLWDPVCGCDGNTYTNSCFAAGDGVNVLHDDECI